MNKQELLTARQQLNNLLRIVNIAYDCESKIEELKTIIEKGTDLSPSEDYWRAKLSIQQGTFDKIMVEYIEAYSDFTKGDKTPDYISESIKVQNAAQEWENEARDQNDFNDMTIKDIREVEGGC